MRLLSTFIIIMLLVPGVIFGTIYANWLECAYGECTENSNSSTGSIQSGGQISTLVILGAGHFLKSHSDFQLFLNKYELSELQGVNYEELQGILNNCISSIENAIDTYLNLKTIALATHYNQSFIEALKDFDFDGFQVGLNLNPLVFQEVKCFLGNGDVNGAINAIYIKLLDILDGLYNLNHDIDKNNLPPISKVWELSHLYSNSLSFGQYISRIFYSIL